MAINTKRFMSPGEREYLDSGDWKCPESPTGAHWWDCNVKPSVCKICGKVNKVAARAVTTLPA
ncbi:MAG: hypothetical protein Q7R50_05670 [Dehalococcoidales bacterium]|nr:hypothetical protein [Dehalococcoidales bacterium]